jgi:drug/metabolite transporter (DMT)-like permease
MIWLLFALVAALFTAAYRVTTRHVMKAHSPYAYALLINLFGSFLTLPLIWTDFSWEQMPQHWWPWLLVLASSVLWATIMVVAFTSMKLVPVSRREQISQVEVVFVLVFAALVLRESLTWMKVVGALLVVGGALVAAVGRTSVHSGWRSRGVVLTVIVAALYALVAIVDAAALRYFPTGLLTFMLYFFPFVILAAFLAAKRHRVSTMHLVHKKGWVVIGATLLSVTSYYTGLRAYDVAEASTVYPVLKLAMVFAVIGGIVFFKEERVHITRKLLAAILVLLGVIVVAAGGV